jgi:hypothetical protein
MVQVFNKPHSSRVREGEFLAALLSAHTAVHVSENFALARGAIERHVDTKQLSQVLREDRYLPNGRRQRLIEVLSKLPEKVLVTLDPKKISFDFVIVRGTEQYFFEFHEKQHGALTVDRPQNVYDLAGQAYVVPRFVQRFVRDVWRAQNFPDYTIVWHDWFARHREQQVGELLRGFHEYHLPGTFSFRELLGFR